MVAGRIEIQLVGYPESSGGLIRICFRRGFPKLAYTVYHERGGAGQGTAGWDRAGLGEASGAGMCGSGAGRRGRLRRGGEFILLRPPKQKTTVLDVPGKRS